MLWNTVELLLQTAGVWSRGLDGSINVCIQRMVPLSWNCPHVCGLLEWLGSRQASRQHYWNFPSNFQNCCNQLKSGWRRGDQPATQSVKKVMKKKTLEALWLPCCCSYTDVTSFRNFGSVVWSRNNRSNHSLFTHSALCPTLISVCVFSPFFKNQARVKRSQPNSVLIYLKSGC